MKQPAPPWLVGVHTAPNIQSAPEIYEIENQCADPLGKVEEAIWGIAPWKGKVVLDLGAGTGFHLSRFHKEASHVFGVEPHDRSRQLAMKRVVELGLEKVSLMTGSAENILLPSNCVDIIHARFAYFFGPGCEKGLAEVERVLCRGGHAFIIAHDWQQGDFARWLRQSSYVQHIDPDKIEAFWQGMGFTKIPVLSTWTFERREDMRDVVFLEFPQELAHQILAEHSSLEFTYGYAMYHREYGHN